MDVRSYALISFLIPMLLALSVAFGCQRQSQPGFDQVEPGMSREQVRAILGNPSSTYDREVNPEGTLVRIERWQYGDNLSTLTTGVFFSDMPSDHVWTVFFDDEGCVVGIQEPDRNSRSGEGGGGSNRFDDPIDPAIPSRNR